MRLKVDDIRRAVSKQPNFERYYDYGTEFLLLWQTESPEQGDYLAAIYREYDEYSIDWYWYDYTEITDYKRIHKGRREDENSIKLILL